MYWGKGYCLPRLGTNCPLDTAWTETKWKSPQSFPAHRSLHFPQPCMSLLVVSRWHSPLASALPCVPQHVPWPPRLQNGGLQVSLESSGFEGDTATLSYQALIKINEGGGSSRRKWALCERTCSLSRWSCGWQTSNHDHAGATEHFPTCFESWQWSFFQLEERNDTLNRVVLCLEFHKWKFNTPPPENLYVGAILLHRFPLLFNSLKMLNLWKS